MSAEPGVGTTRQIHAISLDLEAHRARSAALVARCDDLAVELFRARRSLADAHAQLAATGAAFAQTGVELAAERAELNRIRAELAQVRTELTQADAQRVNATVERDRARAIVALMESSRFWRARLIWVRLRRLLLAAHLL
jgi:chromosome segregation ATPase